MSKEEYLRVLTEQIRCKNVRKCVEKEIEAHLDDQIEMNKMNGMDEAEAVKAAVGDMGDPVETGVSLDRIHRKIMPWKEIIFIGILGLGGLILQYFLQNIFQIQEYMISTNTGRQLLLFVMSFLLMVVICYFDYSWIGYYAKELMILLTAAILIGRKIFGVMHNGSLSWIYIGRISLSIPMLLLLFVPLYGAILYSYRGQKYKGIIKSICWMFPGIGLSMLSPYARLYTGHLLLVSFGLLLTLAVMKNWYKVSKLMVLIGFWGFVLMVPVMLVGYLIIWGEVYQKQRLEWIFLRGPGDHFLLDSVRNILANSSWLGTGESSAAIVLEEHILTYTLSYYGIFAGIMVIGLLAALFVHLYSISVKQKNQMGMIMGTGCACVFLFEFAAYLLENLGIMYFGTCYCPFLTYGGSGMFVTYILFGIILSISRYEKVYPESGGKKRIFIKIHVAE